MSCNRLDQLDWQYTENEYRLTLSLGRAVIKERTSENETIYEPEIQAQDGTILASFPHGLNIEEAQDFVRANLNLIDQHNVGQPEFIEKLVTTIDLCIGLLPEVERRFHRMRLENIKRWLRLPRYAERIVPDETNDWLNYEFEWTQLDGRYIADTFHGKAVIEEHVAKSSKASFGIGSRYRSQIIDSTGVILQNYYVPPKDFAEAENAVRRMLRDLEIPAIDEIYLALITFTLQICHCVLPKNADLMHSVRLDYIDTYAYDELL